MKLLTGNDLATGDVIWWSGSGWSRHVADAVDTGDKGDGIASAEEAARRVNTPYVIDAEAGPSGPFPIISSSASAPLARPCVPTSPSKPPTRRQGAM